MFCSRFGFWSRPMMLRMATGRKLSNREHDDSDQLRAPFR